MRHYSLYVICITITVGLIALSCHDTPVEPQPKTYPLDLTVTSENTSVKLEWTALTVSTFEEYIIVRSEDSIPDSPEPELVGNATIVKRIDQSDITEFIDFAPPISKSVYYKVYGKIGNRFLSTPTVRANLSLQIINLRTDAVAIDQEKNEIIGYDRSAQNLFIYNYRSEEVSLQKFISLSNPIIKLGSYNSKNEIYITDQFGSMYVFDRGNLNLIRQSTNFTRAYDFIYDQGRFIITTQASTNLVMDRSTMQVVDEESGLSTQRRLYAGERNGDELEILEIGTNHINKYILDNTDLKLVSSNQEIPGGSQLISDARPDGSEFMINGSGNIIDNDLQHVAVLEDGVKFHSFTKYTSDGSKLFTVGFFLNEILLKFFDVEDGYKKISENQIITSPTHMFSDEDEVFLMAIIFLNGGVRTALFNYDIP